MQHKSITQNPIDFQYIDTEKSQSNRFGMTWASENGHRKNVLLQWIFQIWPKILTIIYISRNWNIGRIWLWRSEYFISYITFS